MTMAHLTPTIVFFNPKLYIFYVRSKHREIDRQIRINDTEIVRKDPRDNVFLFRGIRYVRVPDRFSVKFFRDISRMRQILSRKRDLKKKKRTRSKIRRHVVCVRTYNTRLRNCTR